MQSSPMPAAGEQMMVVAAETAGDMVSTETVLMVPETETVFPGMQRHYIAVRKPKPADGSEAAMEPGQVNRL